MSNASARTLLALCVAAALGGCAERRLRPAPIALDAPTAPATQPATVTFDAVTPLLAMRLAVVYAEGAITAAERLLAAEAGVAVADELFAPTLRPSGRAGVVGGSDLDDEARAGVGLNVIQRTAIGTRLRVGATVDRFGDQYRNAASVGVTQPLLRGASPTANRQPIWSAAFTERSAARGLDIARSRVALAALERLYQVAALERLAARQAEAIGRAERLANAEAARAETLGVDSTVARTRLLAIRDAAAATGERLRAARVDLAALIGYGGPIDALVVDVTTPAVAPDDIDDAPARAAELALQYRVEFDQARDAAEQAELRLVAASDAALPELNLGLDYVRFGSDADLGESFSFEDDSFSVTLSSSGFGSRRARMAALIAARTGVLQARRSLDSTEEAVREEARRAAVAVERGRAQREARAAELALAERRLRAIAASFDAGLAEIDDLYDAEGRVDVAAARLFDAELDADLSLYRLRAATGTLLAREDRP